ncbi:CoA transferase [Bradyrhizobium diazoefficiens]|uniref:CaiB/BaiF CoA transferase family protein n=1 Tax=Bradyrhizobium diazoefficiens TaxID=1355477 RepID=UPI00190A1070|nr:CaiB/BaiF CoA-transferase family protein [Bradyrhizobium diazoefficiens]QQO35577.1 CoA transferase [Bradyrhizobium diazoefficiens]
MGVLDGLKVVEMASLGPAPVCGSMLADLGADVVMVERPATDVGQPRPSEIYNRGKRSIVLDLKKPGAVNAVLKLVERADALIEGMRPGVMERLGLGPDVCLARRPSLVYGRMTGWGQHGPLALTAGHDGNYIGISGALWLSIARGQRPEPPLSLLGDVAGGSLYLAIGVLAGVMHARKGGRGQVVDAAMVDGSAHLLNQLLSTIAQGGGNFCSGKPASDERHFARSYRCADGNWINLAAMEPKFYSELIALLGLDQDEQAARGLDDPELWPILSQRFTQLFASKSRDEWSESLEGTDACFAPVLSPPNAAVHPHNVARGLYTQLDGILQVVAAPRFLSTPSAAPSGVPARGAHTEDLLYELRLGPREIDDLRQSGALG